MLIIFTPRIVHLLYPIVNEVVERSDHAIQLEIEVFLHMFLGDIRNELLCLLLRGLHIKDVLFAKGFIP